MTAGREPDSDAISAQQERAIASLFENLPDSYAERFSEMQKIRRLFYNELAKQFQPALNAYATSQPQATSEERNALASWINQTVRQLGLSIVCPRTSQPAILVSDVSRTGVRQTLRFRFETTNAARRHVRSGTSSELPDLELMQAPGRVESLSRTFKQNQQNPASR